MDNRRLFTTLENGLQNGIQATAWFRDDSNNVLVLLEGAKISASANAASPHVGKLKITTVDAHGLDTGDKCRIVGHRNVTTPTVADMYADVELVVLLKLSDTEVVIDVAFTEVGARGAIGRPTEDLIFLTHLETALRSKFENAPAQGEVDRIS